MISGLIALSLALLILSTAWFSSKRFVQNETLRFFTLPTLTLTWGAFVLIALTIVGPLAQIALTILHLVLAALFWIFTAAFHFGVIALIVIFGSRYYGGAMSWLNKACFALYANLAEKIPSEGFQRVAQDIRSHLVDRTVRTDRTLSLFRFSHVAMLNLIVLAGFLDALCR